MPKERDLCVLSTIWRVLISARSLNLNFQSSKGSSGIGIISDTDPQPIVINSHLGKFAIVTVAKINNITELERDLLAANMHFSEMSLAETNQTELIALLIVQGKIL